VPTCRLPIASSRDWLADLDGFAGLVADTAYRHHDFRVLRISFDLGTKPLHVHVDQSGVGGMAVSPHLLEQYFAAKDLPGPPGQGEQEIKLQRCELDLNSVPLDLMPIDADREIPNPQSLYIDLFSGRHPAESSFDSRD
jgi:hypothetical protein